MQLYIDWSARVYGIYLKYISKEDIHVYSIDEVFMDVTRYLDMYQMSGKELGVKIMEDVYETTGITASVGWDQSLSGQDCHWISQPSIQKACGGAG